MRIHIEISIAHVGNKITPKLLTPNNTQTTYHYAFNRYIKNDNIIT